MKLHSINKTERLYVRHCGDGFSCYGFDVLDRKARAVAAWCGLSPPAYPLGTRDHFEHCDGILTGGAMYASQTGKRCDAELSPQLAGLEGCRVEVVTTYGETRRFIVGKSTGWLPCHLEVKRRDSSGGPGAERSYASVCKLYKVR